MGEAQIYHLPVKRIILHNTLVIGVTKRETEPTIWPVVRYRHGVGEVGTNAVELPYPVPYRLVGEGFVVEQRLGHARLKLLAETPHARCRVGRCGAFAAFALPVFILKISEIEGRVGRKVRVVGYAKSLARPPAFGRNHHHTIFGAGAVEGSRRGSFQHRHLLNVVGVDRTQPVAPVGTVGGPGAKITPQRIVGVVNRYAVHHDKRVVLPRKGRLAPDADFGGSGGAGTHRGDVYPGHFPLQTTHKIRGSVHRNLFRIDRCRGITQRFRFALNTQCGYNHLVEILRFVF